VACTGWMDPGNRAARTPVSADEPVDKNEAPANRPARFRSRM